MTRAEWVKVIDERQNMYVKQLADIIKQNSLRKEIFFNSPTGTGKTVMIAKLINLLNEEEYFFIITTLSRGGLNHQVETKNDKRKIMYKNKEKNEEKTLEEELKNYLDRNTKEEKAPYFVDDCFGVSKEEVCTLFILESPHIEEVKDQKPLMGLSGKAVSKFIGLGDSELGANLSALTKYKIAIVNVSNIPLQVIDANKCDCSKLENELRKIRTQNEVEKTIYEAFAKKMQGFNKIERIIVCGAFAEKYFDKFIMAEENSLLLKKSYKKQVEIIKVPHPSRGQWQFIDKHMGNLEKVKNIFNNG